jgi:cation:H+ antiporter
MISIPISSNLIMLLPLISIVAGLALLVWSADRFVSGSAVTARHLGMPPLLIGMLVIGFGTSAPEMVVSALAAWQGNPGIALGNAYGSNITNIGLILGLTALLCPITVQSTVLRREMPLLLGITALAAWQLHDNQLTSLDAWVLLGVFLALMGLSVWQGMQKQPDALGTEMAEELQEMAMPIRSAVFWMCAGLLLLIASSRALVWGAVEIAQLLGVSDLIIGLTIIAVGTSLPELASSLIAMRKGEHDIALGNVLGSNFFNTLAVVGIAGAISPLAVAPEVFTRDITVMAALTLLLTLFAWSRGRTPPRLNRLEGGILLACYGGYNLFLVTTVFAS